MTSFEKQSEQEAYDFKNLIETFVAIASGTFENNCFKKKEL